VSVRRANAAARSLYGDPQATYIVGVCRPSDARDPNDPEGDQDEDSASTYLYDPGDTRGRNIFALLQPGESALLGSTLPGSSYSPPPGWCS
jgi:hypothetical protein